MDETKEAAFQIKDRRRFHADGTSKGEGSSDESSAHESQSQKPTQKAEDPKSPEPEFEINFSTFILSLASSVQIALGLVPHPATGKPSPNLVSARQTIDILGMLDSKTRGNLTGDEEALLRQVVYELRVHYVQLVEQMNKK